MAHRSARTRPRFQFLGNCAFALTYAAMRVAGALAGPNVNAVTDDAYLEPLSGTAVLNGVPVTVSASGDRAQ